MTFSVDVTVRGYELDTQGHLNQAVYLQYAEHARWELLRAAGLPQDKLLADGIGPVQLEVTVKYRRELRGGERVRVTCRFAYGTGKTFTMEQRIIKEDGTVAAEVTGVAWRPRPDGTPPRAGPAGPPRRPGGQPGPADGLTAVGGARSDRRAGRRSPAPCGAAGDRPVEPSLSCPGGARHRVPARRPRT